MKFRLKDWKGFEGKVKFNLQRHYVSQGKAVIGFAFGFIALFGISSQNVSQTLLLGVLFYIACYFLGRYWCKHHWFSAEMEVNNRFNPFVKEMRRSIKTKRFK